MKKLLAMLLVLTVAVGIFAGCTGGSNSLLPDKAGEYSYSTYTTVMPSNWNELTYEDANDTQILDYLSSSFYTYDYKFEGGKFKADGSINAEGIVAGGYSVDYSAATALVDVTSTVDEKWGYTEKQKAAGSYAWKITLREDLKWDDGTPIDAYDFVYSMQQQLDPLFQNMRASTYYNNIQIKGTRNYVYQGQEKAKTARDLYSTWSDEAKADASIYFDILSDETGFGSWAAKKYSEYRDNAGEDTGWSWLVCGLGAETTPSDVLKLQGKSFVEISASEELSAIWAAVIGMWKSEPDEELDFFAYTYTYPTVNFDTVGLYAESQYELVVCLDSPIACLKEDGSLSYQAPYYFSSLPLVKEDLYEKCKQAPAAGSTLWTSNYNSSKDTTASWGPYKLTYFQNGKSYTLEKNTYWYGYDLPENAGQYQLDRIVCQLLETSATQWSMFLAGEIDSIGLDVDHADDYRNSKYTRFTPGTGTFGINLYADLAGLKASGRNNGILAIDDFRKAMALYLDRDEMNAALYTAHRSCYGIMGPSYYYDVENGGVYRDSEQAMKGLLRVYGFTELEEGKWSDGVTTYADYKAAYAAMNGMNRTLAKELVEKAYTELTTNAETYGYDASKKIEIKYGTSADNESTRRSYNYMVSYIADLVKGTSLEGKIDVTFDASFGSKWSDEFKGGAYDIAAGTGFQGGAFDPAGFLQCYVDPDADLMYSVWWDTDTETMTFTMPEGDYEGAGEELTMSVYNWYCCVNGVAESYEQEYTYNWGAGQIDESARLEVIAAIEELILGKYYTIVTTSSYSATVYSAKWSYISDDYNTFMGYGGIRYMTANYDDAEWIKYINSNNGNLSSEYKKSE